MLCGEYTWKGIVYLFNPGVTLILYHSELEGFQMEKKREEEEDEITKCNKVSVEKLPVCQLFILSLSLTVPAIHTVPVTHCAGYSYCPCQCASYSYCPCHSLCRLFILSLSVCQLFILSLSLTVPAIHTVPVTQCASYSYCPCQ